MVETIKNEVEEEPEINNVIIFDDMGAYLRDNNVKQLLKEIIIVLIFYVKHINHLNLI